MFNPLKAKLDDMRVILATSSQQRHAILRSTGLKFETQASDFAEDLDIKKYTFEEYVKETALHKVLSVQKMLENDDIQPDIIIGTDTMVSCNGRIFGKPADEEEAVSMIKELANSGHPHSVLTGVVIYYKGSYDKFVEICTVHMMELSDEEVMGYIATGEYKGKAGGYAIQGIAGSFVEKIEGDFNNVVGFPLCAITKRLKHLVN